VCAAVGWMLFCCLALVGIESRVVIASRLEEMVLVSKMMVDEIKSLQPHSEYVQNLHSNFLPGVVVSNCPGRSVFICSYST
jgi:hypothetical protein